MSGNTTASHVNPREVLTVVGENNEKGLTVAECVPSDASGAWTGFLSSSVRAGVGPSHSAPLWVIREVQK